MSVLPTRRGRDLPSCLFAAALLAGWALPVQAGSTVDLFVGPHDSEALEPKSLRAMLDGAPLPVTQALSGADPAQAIYSGPLAPGPHRLEVELVATGTNPFFTYTRAYAFTLRGRLDVEAKAGEVVAVQARVTDVEGFTVPWVDKHRLALRATAYRSGRAVEDQPKAAPPPPVAAPPPAPPPATCALPTIHFAFDKSELDGTALAAIDGFARCLAGSTGTVRLQGHADPQGPADYNQWLGEQRAKAVAAALVARGVARQRLRVESFGESRLACTEASRACYARNRRVEALLED